jgi:mRNA export factor
MADPPTDSISSIAFSSQADYLAVGSWDNSVRPVKYFSTVKYSSTRTGPNLRGDSVWPVTRKGNVPTPRSCFRGLLEQGTSEHSRPYVLSFMSLCRRGTKSFLEEQTMLGVCSTSQPASRRRSRSTTRQSRLYDGSMHLRLGFWRRLAGIRPSKYVPCFVFVLVNETHVLQYWDLRAPAPVATVTLPERCYTFDVQYPLMVVGTAERHVQIFNLTNPNTAYKVSQDPKSSWISFKSCV